MKWNPSIHYFIKMSFNLDIFTVTFHQLYFLQYLFWFPLYDKNTRNDDLTKLWVSKGFSNWRRLDGVLSQPTIESESFSQSESEFKISVSNPVADKIAWFFLNIWFILKCRNKISWIVSWCDWMGLGSVNFWKSCPWWNWSSRWSMFCISRCWGRAKWSIVNCLPCLKYVCQAFVYSLSRIGVYNPWDKRKYTLPTLLYII